MSLFNFFRVYRERGRASKEGRSRANFCNSFERKWIDEALGILFQREDMKKKKTKGTSRTIKVRTVNSDFKATSNFETLTDIGNVH